LYINGNFISLPVFMNKSYRFADDLRRPRVLLPERLLLNNARMCCILLSATRPAHRTRSIEVIASLKFGGLFDSQRQAACAFAITAVRGWFNSCAIDADNSATVAMRAPVLHGFPVSDPPLVFARPHRR
jgi:hypothetical protein